MSKLNPEAKYSESFSAGGSLHCAFFDNRDKTFEELLTSGDIPAKTEAETNILEFERLEHNGELVGIRRNIVDTVIEDLATKVSCAGGVGVNEQRVSTDGWGVDDIMKRWDAEMERIMAVVRDHFAANLRVSTWVCDLDC